MSKIIAQPQVPAPLMSTAEADLRQALQAAYTFITQPRRMTQTDATYDCHPHNYSALTSQMRKALAPRENPLHPMFAGHNCAYCGSGQKPCRQGNPSQCDNPRARND